MKNNRADNRQYYYDGLDPIKQRGRDLDDDNIWFFWTLEKLYEYFEEKEKQYSSKQDDDLEITEEL